MLLAIDVGNTNAKFALFRGTELLARWRIATLADLDHGGRQSVKFRFRLDAGQLPRTLQVGAVGETDWELSVERQIDVTAEVVR